MKYKINDIIINKEGNKRKILEAFTNVYIISNYDDFLISAGTATQEFLDQKGYTLHDEWSPENLKDGDEYWYIDSMTYIESDYWEGSTKDQYRLKTKNVFTDEASAKARLKEIMES
jgi:hypothetical protein